MPKNDLISPHVQANASALKHYAAFDTHRTKLTSHALRVAPQTNDGTLCVLGAGNCFDLDLERLTSRYSEIHLVDIDAAALDRAIARHPATVREKLTPHAPVDLSGLVEPLERWRRFEVTPEELMNHGANTAAALHQRLGRRFDVVLSACMLSQMHLSVLEVLSDTHPLFQAVRWTLNLTHFRTLAELTKSGGRTLFATDVTGEHLYPITSNTLDGLTLLDAAVKARKVFDFADPGHLQAMLLDDPRLLAVFPAWSVQDAWLWTNGPDTTFLVYACDLPRT